MRALPLALCGFALLIAAQVVASTLLAPRRAAFTPHADVFDALKPGEFAGTLMLGGFRGLACDLLWMRAQGAKERHQFYESVTLFQAITRIQPRFEQIWTYVAHDLAYNVAAEVDDEDAKYAWYLAGLEANARGAERNPGSRRILRHLGWMLFHKGERFATRMEGATWAPLFNGALAKANDTLPPDRRLPLLPAGPGLSNFALSAQVYALCARLDDEQGSSSAPFVRRMPALMADHDGSLRRNRGQTLAAFQRYLDSIDAWVEAARWHDAPGTGDPTDSSQRRIAREARERNEGPLLRQCAEIIRRLAPADQQERAQAMLSARDTAGLRAVIAAGGWKTTLDRGAVRWLDEQPAAP